ncbi:MAG: hypothetical protein WBO04_07460 [Steroidobacteraceae bacterium]
MRYLVPAMLFVVAIIHLLPLPGVLGSERLSALYGLSFDDPNLQTLMRHRAVLFGLLGVFIMIAAFRPSWQPLAIAAGLVSVVSFLALAWYVGGHNPQVGRVFTVDVVALVCLLIGTVALMFERRGG